MQADHAIHFAGAAYQAQLLRAGELSSTELVTETLRRIDRHDRQLNAFRTVLAEDALVTAAEADARLGSLDHDAPLLGVPIAVKEDLAVAGQPRTLGTHGVTRVQHADCEAVRRRRAAGAVVIGLTRAPELMLWPYTESTRSGPTRNPWSLEHSPGGSSGGSAAAVAAGLVGAALGTDGGGSIRIPSAASGVFGWKPPPGSIPWDPLDVPWHGLASIGPITRHVRDAVLLTGVLRRSTPARGVESVQSLESNDRLRVAVSLRPWGLGVRVRPEVRAAVEETEQVLSALGHEVHREDPELLDPTMIVGYAPRYLRSAADNLAELDRRDLTERRTRRVSALGRLFGDRLIARSRRFGERIAERANSVFERADVLLTPVLPGTAMRLGAWEGFSIPRLLAHAPVEASFTALWNVAGNPAASVPAGLTEDGLPLAVQLIGRHGGEQQVLAAASQLERARPWAQLRPPGFD
ncbi:MAG: amidase family protein [Sciscionella sp.]